MDAIWTLVAVVVAAITWIAVSRGVLPRFGIMGG
jgi:hypothetical protein